MKNNVRQVVVLLLLAGLAPAAPDRYEPGVVGRFEPEPYGDAHLVRLAGGYTIDTRQGEPVLPARYRQEEPATGSAYYIVKFAGPVRPEWHWELERMAIWSFGYLPHYAVLAELNPSQRAAARSLPWVAWVGLYQPAYKLQRQLLNSTGVREIVIQLVPGESPRSVVDCLDAGRGRVRDISADPGGSTICATIDASLLPTLARLPAVLWLEEWSEVTTCSNQGQWVVQTGWRATAPPDNDMTARRVWQQGVRGEGVVLGLTDTGLNLYGPGHGHDMFRDPARLVTPPGIWPDHRKVIAYKCFHGADAVEGLYHGSHVAGIAAGDDSAAGGTSYYDGTAIKARLVFADIYNGSTSVAPANLWPLWDTVYGSRGLPGSMRCFQHSGSWGPRDSTGEYLIRDASTDAFAWAHKDFLNIMAAGNEAGHRRIRHPGLAKNVITVGALQNGVRSNRIADFSSRGPAADGRLKPNICAPGDVVYSATQSPATNTYLALSGTSLSTPMVSGALGLVRCYLKDGFYPSGRKTAAHALERVSAALLRSMAYVSTDPNIGSLVVPGNDIGWGRIDADSVLYFAGDKRRLLLRDDTFGLGTGEYAEYTFRVDTNRMPLRVCLSWTDTAGACAAGRALVNDLNLVLTAPDGTTYHGNQYAGGVSLPDPAGWDELNVDECARVNAPGAGEWTLCVKAVNVVRGRQPYAWTVTGALRVPGVPAFVNTPGECLADRPGPVGVLRVVPSGGPHTAIRVEYSLPRAGKVSLKLYDITGKLVTTLAAGYRVAGFHSISVNQRSSAAELGSGIYILKLATDAGITTAKFIIE